MNRQIIDYVILSTAQLYCLKYFYEDILTKNYNGYELLGAPFMKDKCLCQAMVKYAKEDN
jgi:hypothetical protein